MAKEKQSGLRLSFLKVENYKKLDKLEIEFPKPKMANDLDIFVLGSRNGGGKTSVLECSALAFIAGSIGEHAFRSVRDTEWLADITDLLVKSGHDSAEIHAVFTQDGNEASVTLKLSRASQFKIEVKGGDVFRGRWRDRMRTSINSGDELLKLFAMSSEPILLPPLLHFNSYRKIQEGNPELGMMSEDPSYFRSRPYRMRMGRPTESPVSAFKVEMLRGMMGQAELFENLSSEESTDNINKLNELLTRYAGGKIEKLRPRADNKIDFRITPYDGSGSFTFDGLSSGQKEIIATLYLIWRHTNALPSIVLIDEPELHLNAEWHGDFVQQLSKLAPKNQYIVATHSEQVFDSVDEDRRAVLEPLKDKTNLKALR